MTANTQTMEVRKLDMRRSAYLFAIMPLLLLTLTVSPAAAVVSYYSASFKVITLGRCVVVQLDPSEPMPSPLAISSGIGSFYFQGKAQAEGPSGPYLPPNWPYPFIQYMTVTGTMRACGLVGVSWFGEGKKYNLLISTRPTSSSIAWLEPYQDFMTVMSMYPSGMLQYSGIFWAGSKARFVQGACGFMLMPLAAMATNINVDPSDSIVVIFIVMIDNTLAYEIIWTNKNTHVQSTSGPVIDISIPAAKVFERDIKVWIT